MNIKQRRKAMTFILLCLAMVAKGINKVNRIEPTN